MAQTMQWIGALGVVLIVQTGKVFGFSLGVQSKHSVSPGKMTMVCPRYPAVPLSTKGTPTDNAMLLTYRRASKLSNAFRMIVNPRKKLMGNKCVSLMSAQCAVI